MSASPNSSPAWIKWLSLTAGVCLILGGLFGLTRIGMSGWDMWKIAHAPPAQRANAANAKPLPGQRANSISAKPAPLTAEQIASRDRAQEAQITWFVAQATVSLVFLYLGCRLLPLKSKKRANFADAAAATIPDFDRRLVSAPKRAKRASSNRWQACNVLQSGAGASHLWYLNASKNGFALAEDLTLPVDGTLPQKQVARDWKELFQPKLNIALLPVEKVFLRVVHLPVSDFGEILAMVELQMEKLSPLPVTQVVWSIQVLPHTVENLQTVVVLIAPRDLVEEMLGKLEKQGYLADRLDLSILDQLLATPITGDGAWLYPAAAGPGAFAALVAWWHGGALRNLGLLHVPAGYNSADLLKEQLTQMAWAGELEGWLTSIPQWHLVADEATAANWQPMFRAWLGQPAEVVTPLSEPELAALTANRAARADSRANILPPEYTARYHDQFVDRLWMRGLGTVLTLYIAGVMIYFAALQVQSYKADQLDHEAYALSVQYTNTLKLKNQLQILQDRQALKYASLDCWKITAELLPDGFTVDSLDFRNGRSLSLHGNGAR